MSWGFQFVAKSKEDALAELDKIERERSDPHAFNRVPAWALEGLRETVRNLAPTDVGCVQVVASGHADTSYGNAQLSVNVFPFVRAADPPGRSP